MDCDRARGSGWGLGEGEAPCPPPATPWSSTPSHTLVLCGWHSTAGGDLGRILRALWRVIWGTLALHHQVQVILGQSWGRARQIWDYLEGAEGFLQGSGRGNKGRYGGNMRGYRKLGGSEWGYVWRNWRDTRGYRVLGCHGGEIWDMTGTGS